LAVAVLLGEPVARNLMKFAISYSMMNSLVSCAPNC